jgi:hypothetical protein
MSDESRLEEQLIQEAMQLDAEKRKPQSKQEPTDVSLPVEPIQSAVSQEENQVQELVRDILPIRESPQQENFRYLREERERLERKLEQERKEKEELIRYMQQANLQAQQQTQPEPIDEEIQAPENEYLEGKHLNKYQQQMRLRLDRESKARQDSEKRMYEMMVQQQLMMENPDYRQVFTPENLDKLEKMKPDLAKSIMANPDPLSKRNATLDAIRTYVIPARKNEMDTRAKELELRQQSERVSKNFNKPVPTSSTMTSPLSKANAFSDGTLTDERKTELFEDWHKKSTASYNFKR